MAHHHKHAGGHDHSHGPGAAHGHAAGTALTRALALTLGFAFVEGAVGVLSGSLALLSDAAHMLVDSGALGLAVFAQRLAARPRTASHTFGYRRAEVLAAAISGGALFTASIGIIIEAFGRLRVVHEVRGDWMFATAVTGLVVNLASGGTASSGVTVVMSQLGSSVTGTWDTGDGVHFGALTASLTGFSVGTWTMIMQSGCGGSFSGNATISADAHTITATYNGLDCHNTHSGGHSTIVR